MNANVGIRACAAATWTFVLIMRPTKSTRQEELWQQMEMAIAFHLRPLVVTQKLLRLR